MNRVKRRAMFISSRKSNANYLLKNITPVFEARKPKLCVILKVVGLMLLFPGLIKMNCSFQQTFNQESVFMIYFSVLFGILQIKIQFPLLCI